MTIEYPYKRILVTGGCGFIGSSYIQNILRYYGDIEDKNMEPKDVLRVKNEDFKMIAKRPYNTILNSKKFTHNCNYKIPTWEEELLSIMDQI